MKNKKQVYKLDISKILSSIDMKIYNFYENLSPEDRKGYQPYILLRFMSSAPDQNNQHEYFCEAVNTFANVGFWELSKHPELQHRILCSIANGRKTYHKWITTKSEKNDNSFFKYFTPELDKLTQLEKSIILKKYNQNQAYEIMLENGADEKDAKKFCKNFRV